MSSFDTVCEKFNKLVKQSIVIHDEEEGPYFDLEKFCNLLKDESEDIITSMGRTILNSKNDFDEIDITDRIMSLLYSLKGECDEEAMIIHKSSNGILIKGHPIEGIKVVIESATEKN